jgi:hypothetical protein
MTDRATEALDYLHAEGFSEARVESCHDGYLVALGGFWAGHTAISDKTPADPLDFAKLQVAAYRGQDLEQAALETGPDTFIEDVEDEAEEFAEADAASHEFLVDTGEAVEVGGDATSSTLGMSLSNSTEDAANGDSGSAGVEDPEPPNYGGEMRVSGGAGTMVVPDEIGALRNHVIAQITFAELARTRAMATDPNWHYELSGLRSWAVDGGKALPPMSDEQKARLEQLEQLDGRIRAARAHADELRNVAVDAPEGALRMLAENFDKGWPQ